MWPQVHHFIIHPYTYQNPPSIEIQLLNELFQQLEAYLGQLIQARKKIIIKPIRKYQGLKNQITKALMDLILCVQLELYKEKQNQLYQTFVQSKHGISLSLFKELCLMSQYELFETQCKYHTELAKSMLLEKNLLETFKLSLLLQEEGITKVTFDQLDDIFENLLAPDYRWKFLDNIYALHSGTVLSIQRSGFQHNLKCIITNMGRGFAEKNNLVTRNLKNVQKSQFITDIVTHSIKIICNYKNADLLQKQISQIAQIIFVDQLKMTKDQWRNKMEGFLNSFGSSAIGFKSKPLNKNSSLVIHTLWLYLDLLRVQALMLQDPGLMEKIKTQKQVDTSNFYCQQMQKLLQKCPFNGDEACDCRKCLCIRRNRESAKISQDKKRNAVQQIYPLKKRIEELERKNKQIDQENAILKGIVNQLRKYSTQKALNIESAMDMVGEVLDN